MASLNFEYTAGADRPHTQRLWVGPLADPKETIGIIVSNGFVSVHIVLPNDRILELIETLQRAIDEQEAH